MRLTATIVAFMCFVTADAGATGLATCDSGPTSGWRPEAELRQKISALGWKIRRIKEDGGCYEVYAIDQNGKRIEVYFHPLTLNVVPTSRYP
jgi:hypothetical protein